MIDDGQLVSFAPSGLTSYSIPNSVTLIGNFAFYGCSGLTSVEIPNSVTSIGSHAFEDCSGLTSVEIPNSVTSIGSYTFSRCSSLKSVEIPNSVTTIENYAFYNCTGLDSVTSYSITPPSLGYGPFSNICSNAELFVPNVSLYNESDWSEYFKEIMPIPGLSELSVTVNLPEVAKDGRYKDMSLELVDKSDGQVYRIVVSEKCSYSFSGLQEGKYGLRLKSVWGEVLGEIEEIEVTDEDLSVQFESLRQPKSVSLNVLANYGEDVTENVTISWLKADGSLMKQGACIAGVLEGSEIAYEVALPDEMLAEYSAPGRQIYTVKADGNNITYRLEPLGKVMFEGSVTDVNGKALPYAVLTISPLINGKYGNSVTATTDAAGNYEIELPNLPAKVTVACNGYISQTIELENLAQGLGAVSLERISGLCVNVIADYTDNMNVAYRALDATGKELEGCIYQGATIVLPESYGIGDELTVVAYSKNNKFKDATQSVVLEGKNTNVQMEIVAYGAISAKCEGDGYGKVALLYNNVGELSAKASFSEGAARFDCVPDGNYTVVAMAKSSTFNYILNLSSLSSAGLSDGVDYLTAAAVAESGEVKEVEFGAIPDLDEAKLFLATGDGSYFMPHKTELTIGGYQTLKGKGELKDEYAGKAKNAVLVVDIPSTCEFVDGSVMAGHKETGYTIDGNRIIIPLEKIDDVVRFCIIPWEAGDIRPSAFVQMEIDGNELLLPLGSAYFEAKKFDLVCVEQTSRLTVALRGAAIKDSEILIYDNETLVGKTTALANGQWTANITFAKPYSHSIHEIYGAVLTTDGKRLLTESRQVEYDKNFVDVGKVTMLYSNGYDHKVYDVDFDPTNGTTSRGFYNYYTGSTDFTFTADFTNTDPSLISSLNFKVLASDGSTRTLEGKYNETTGNWVASSKYADTHKLPVNVKVEFLLTSSSVYNSINEFLDEVNTLDIINTQIIEGIENNGYFEVVLDKDTELACSYKYSDENNPVLLNLQQLDYDVALDLLKEKQFDYIKTDSGFFFRYIDSLLSR